MIAPVPWWIPGRAGGQRPGTGVDSAPVAVPAQVVEERTQQLASYEQAVSACTRCRLAEGRTQVVFGAGNPDAELMFVGEAPGFHEDQQGVPFVGQAGKLLEQLLAGIGLDARRRLHRERAQVPPAGNRDPQPDEIEACEPHLFRQIELIQPQLVATLGNFATKLLSGKPHGITRVHGQEQEDDARRPPRAPLPDLPPGRRALHARDAEGARGGLRPASRTCSAPTTTEARAAPARASRPSLRSSSASSETRPVQIESASPEETEAVAGGSRAPAPGDVVTVAGELGAGKTTFVRGACRALGVDGPVTSPTFTIGHRYDGASTFAPRPLSLRRRLGRGVGRPRAVLRRRRSRSSSGPRRRRRRCPRRACASVCGTSTRRIA